MLEVNLWAVKKPAILAICDEYLKKDGILVKYSSYLHTPYIIFYINRKLFS